MITLLDFKNNFKRKWKSLVFLTNLALFLILGISLLQPFLYKSSFSILIIQDQKDATDVYSSIKSADKLGSLLQRIVKTSDFHDAVMNSGFNLNKDDFSAIEKKKRKQWDEMVDVNLVQDAGILNFDVYYKNKTGAEEYAKAIIHTLVNDGSQFYGASDIIKFRVINTPLTSNRPAKPDILLNSLFGVAVGFLSGLLYIYFTIPVRKNNSKYSDIEFEEEVEVPVVTPEYKKEKVVFEEKKEKNSFFGKKKDIISESRNDIEKKEEEKLDIKVIDNSPKIEVENKNEIVAKEAEKSNDTVENVEENDQEAEVGFLKNVNNRVKNIINE